MVARYHFVTHIELSAPAMLVWETLARSEQWIGWWRWLEEVEVLDEGGSDGVGRRVRHVVGSPIGYRLTYVGVVTAVIEPVVSRFETEGELEGKGQLSLEVTGRDTTLLDFHWLVETPKTWMKLLAPVARPVFVWNHHRLMEDFGRDLAEATSSTLVGVSNRSLSPHDEGFFEMPTLET